MKHCPRCKTDKPLDQFRWKNKAKGKRQPYCIACNKAYQQAHYAANKADYKAKAQVWKTSQRAAVQRKLWAYLEAHPCVDCGEGNPVVLDFDHIDPDTKDASVSRLMSNGASWKRIEAEIAKCDVRCRNCHAIRTAKQLGWYGWRNTPSSSIGQDTGLSSRREGFNSP